MQHAIDIKTITATYYQGYGTPWPASLTENQMGIGGWGDAYPNWPADVQATYTYDPALAKQMLASAGFANVLTPISSWKAMRFRACIRSSSLNWLS